MARTYFADGGWMESDEPVVGGYSSAEGAKTQSQNDKITSSYSSPNNNHVSYGDVVTDRKGNRTQSYAENNRYGTQSGTVALGSVFDPNSQNYDYDYAHGLAENINGQKVFYDSNGNLSSAAQALKDSIANNRLYSYSNSSYVSDSNNYPMSNYALNNSYSAYSNNGNNIDSLYAQRLSAAQAALRDSIAKSKSQYQTTIDQAPQQFYATKNQITADQEMQGQNLRELLANGGQQGGTNRTEQTALNSSYENKLNNINLAQQKIITDAKTAISQLVESGNTQEAQLVAENASERLKALIDQSNADRNYGLQQQQLAQAQANYINDFNFKQAQADIQNKLAQGQLTAQQAQQAIDNAYRQSQANESNARWAEEYHNSKDQAALNRDQSAYQFNQEYGLKLQQLAQQAAAAQQKASGSSSIPKTTTATTNKDLESINDIVNGSYNLSEKARVLQNYINSLSGSSGAQTDYLKAYALQALQAVEQQLSDYNNSGRYAGM